MKALAWTNKGIVHIAAAEIEELVGSDVACDGQFLLFDVVDAAAICRLCYLARGIRGVMSLLGESEVVDLEKSLKKVKFPFGKVDSFAARVKLFDTDADARELEIMIGGVVNDLTGSEVDLDEPKYTVLALVCKDHCFFGIDYAGVDLGKRDYKLFSMRQSLKGNVAYSMVRLAKFLPGKVLLDPFARDGMIGIEAALYSKAISPHYYHKEKFAFTRFMDAGLSGLDGRKGKPSDIRLYDSLFHNISAIKKNAKIAGVDKFVTISRIDVEWVDIKLDENSVDCIVTYPPLLTGHSDQKLILKLYNELFHQAEFVLKKKSRMVIGLGSLKILERLSHSLNQVELIEAYQGEQAIFLVVFQKL